jgi:hypothetical protein
MRDGDDGMAVFTSDLLPPKPTCRKARLGLYNYRGTMTVIRTIANAFIVACTEAFQHKEEPMLEVIVYNNDWRTREIYDRAQWCSGIRCGHTGAMCGGCQGCLESQASHYGCDYVIISMRPITFWLRDKWERFKVWLGIHK